MTGATERPAFPADGPGFPPALPPALPTPPVPVPPGLPPLGDPTPPTPRPPASPSTFPKPGELSPPPAADESAVAAGEALLAAGVLLRREVSLSLLYVPLPAEVSSFSGDHVVTDSGGLANDGPLAIPDQTNAPEQERVEGDRGEHAPGKRGSFAGDANHELRVQPRVVLESNYAQRWILTLYLSVGEKVQRSCDRSEKGAARKNSYCGRSERSAFQTDDAITCLGDFLEKSRRETAAEAKD